MPAPATLFRDRHTNRGGATEIAPPLSSFLRLSCDGEDQAALATGFHRPKGRLGAAWNSGGPHTKRRLGAASTVRRPCTTIPTTPLSSAGSSPAITSSFAIHHAPAKGVRTRATHRKR